MVILNSNRDIVIALLFLLAVTIGPAMADWQIARVASIQKPMYPCLAHDTRGMPHIAYYDGMNGTIMHTWRSGNAWITETVGRSAGTHSLDLAFDSSGTPCICYGEGVHYGNLMFAKKTATGWAVTTVTKGAWGRWGNAGYYSSLAFDHNGMPHIAYVDGSTYATLYYASLNLPMGTWETTKVYAGESWRMATGFETALVFNARNKPYIAFIERKGARPHLMYSFYEDGVAWQTSYLDYGNNDVKRTQRGIDLTLDSHGYPRISYYGKCVKENFERVHYFAWEGDTAAWIRETVAVLTPTSPIDADSATTSIAIDTHNIPHICYVSNNRNIMYASRTAPDTWSLQRVDMANGVDHLSLALNNDGNPAIAYADSSRAQLKIAQWSA